MKKKVPSYYDEIDLIPILNIIWDGKVKIFLTIIISLLIGCGYLYQSPKQYSYASSLVKNDFSEFEKFKNKYFDEFDKNSLIIKKTYVVDKFINELKDHEELMLVLKRTKIFKENFTNIQTTEQNKILEKYIKLFEINETDKFNINLNFKWHNSEETINILKDTIKLTLDNLENSVINDLYEILEQKNNLNLIKDLKRLEYLNDQIWIAKELGISDSQINTITSSDNDLTSYYLIGHKAISKEIELIEKNLKINKYPFFKKDIESLKATPDLKIFNTYQSSGVKLLQNTKLILMISVLSGLIIGSLYVLIPKLSHLKFVFRKTIK